MKLISFSPHQSDVFKVDFTFENNGKQATITLKEKPHWPAIWTQPLYLVEKWFISYYGDLLMVLQWGNKL